MTFEHCYYQIDGGKVATLELGDKQTADVSVVFLHGWLDNAASFTTVMTALAHQLPHAHLCAVDLPGHGLSFHKASPHFYSFHDYIDDVYQVLAKLSPNRTVLVGHSLGALIASCYSAAFPEQVAGLVQIEGDGPLAETPECAVTRLRQGVLSRQRIRRKPVRLMSSADEAIARRASVNSLTEAQITPLVLRGVKQTEQGWAWRHDTALQSDSLYRMSHQHAQAIRDAIVCPQIIVLGEQGFSHLKPVTSEANPVREFVTLSGGHHCHLEHPSRVSDLIFGLVNKI